MAHLLIYYLIIVEATCRPSVVGYGGMAASEHSLATEAGIEILKEGGNAADAALAIQLTLNLVQPTSSGIGGGCFIMYYDSKSQQVYAIDGREEAPKAYNPQVFCRDINCFLQNTANYTSINNQTCSCLDITDTITTGLSTGGLSVGVPGTLYAYYLLNKYFGSLNGTKWSNSFQYAINIARNGFEMDSSLYNSISSSSKLKVFNATRNIYYAEDGITPKVEIGELFANSDMADTLELLSQDPDNAIDIFYKGEIAKAIVNAVQTSNYSVTNRWGLMEEEDINGYKAVFREPVMSTYGYQNGSKYKMWGMNMPSSGSITVQYLMNLLYLTQQNVNDNLNDFENGTTLTDYDIYSDVAAHYLTTVNNIAFADRNKYMADSDFVHVPIDGLINISYLQARIDEYMDDTLVPTPILYGEPPGLNKTVPIGDSYALNEEHGTSHFFVIDKDNNLACITTTIESGWGSGVTVPGYGFLLNNELTDFERLGYDVNGTLIANAPEGGKRVRRTALNAFDLTDSETVGGKRPRSSMSPIIVTNMDNSKPIFAAGSPGGSFIISTTFNVLSKLLIYNMDVQDAIDAARLWAFNAQTVNLEAGWYDNNTDLIDTMVNQRGYTQEQFVTRSNGRCQALKVMEATNNDIKNKGFDIFEGGADDTRREQATVMVVCEGIKPSGNDSYNICIGETDKLTDLQIAMIVSGSIVFVLVIFMVICWYKKYRKKHKHELGQFIGLETTKNYGSDQDNNTENVTGSERL